MAVKKDLLNRELHTGENLELLKMFALDKSQRALVVAKVEKPAANTSVDGVDTTASAAEASNSDTHSSMRQDGNVEILLSTKIEYLGPNAQSIAFLKREDYQKLELSSSGTGDLDKVLDATITSGESSAPAEEATDLSSQIQVVNLGYLG